MDWKIFAKDLQQIELDSASAEQHGALVAKLNADVLRAAQERLSFENEPSTFIRMLRELGREDA